MKIFVFCLKLNSTFSLSLLTLPTIKLVAPKVTLQQLYDDQQKDQINNSTMKIINNGGGGGGGYAIRGQQLQLYCNISANPIVLANDIHWYKDSILINDNLHNMNNNSDGKYLFFFLIGLENCLPDKQKNDKKLNQHY